MKNSRPVLLSRPLVITGLLVSFLLAAGTALLSSISTRNVANAGNRVIETQTTLLEISQLLSSVIDAETGQRGYILTGLDSYLQPYTHAIASLDDQIARLQNRFVNRPEQRDTFQRIAALVTTQEKEMERSIALRRANSIGPSLHLIDSTGLNTMNALREQIRELEKREFHELTLLSSSVAKRARFFQQAGLAMLAVAFVLAGIGFYLFIRRVNELESMITVCAWTRRVKYNGQWVSFEEYLHARFNLEFTHGISEEASKKLKMEAIELVGADAVSLKARTSGVRATPPVIKPA